MSATTSAGADSAVGLYIDDRWREGGRRFDRVNPARPAEIIGQSTAASVEDVAEAFAAAQRAECAWARTPPPARADILVRAAAIIVERATEIARVLSLEEGSGFGDEACAAAGGEIVDMDQVFDEAEPFNVADGRVVHEIVSQAVEAAVAASVA